MLRQGYCRCPLPGSLGTEQAQEALVLPGTLSQLRPAIVLAETSLAPASLSRTSRSCVTKDCRKGKAMCPLMGIHRQGPCLQHGPAISSQKDCWPCWHSLITCVAPGPGFPFLPGTSGVRSALHAGLSPSRPRDPGQSQRGLWLRAGTWGHRREDGMRRLRECSSLVCTRSWQWVPWCQGTGQTPWGLLEQAGV